MRWRRLPALLLFLAVFAVAMVVQAPPELVRRALGTSTPPVLTIFAPQATAAAMESPVLGLADNDTELTWRYERFSLRPFGPVYRVHLAGQGYAGRGLVGMTALSNRLLVTDVRLNLALAHLHEAPRRATYEPLGRVLVTLDRIEADVQPWRIDGLAGRARWTGARSALVPEIELGVIDAELTAPEPGLIRAAITNREGDLAISGTLTLDAVGSLEVDLLLAPRSGAPDAWGHALGALATREDTGWRLRRTISAGSRL